MTWRAYLHSTISRGAFIAAQRGQMPDWAVAAAITHQVMEAIRARGDG